MRKGFRLIYASTVYMLTEFRRYCTLQRDQTPLASLLVYLKRKGGWVQLNQIWKDLGPSSGGLFWNQTTLINKLDKLERLEIILIERRVLPSSRSEEKKKTNTFCRLNPTSLLAPHIYSMLKIYKGAEDKYSSELTEKPLDLLNSLVGSDDKEDPVIELELEASLDLLSEIFKVERGEAKKMVKERMARKGLLRDSER